MHVRRIAWAAAGVIALSTVVVSSALRPATFESAEEVYELVPAESYRLFAGSLPDFVVHPAIFSATDVAPLGQGWVVLDGRGHQMHVLAEDLSVVRSFGREGEGPGEMLRPAQVAVLGDSTIGVLERPFLSLHVFTAEGDFIERIEPRILGCPGSSGGDLLPGRADSFVIAGRCPSMDGFRWVAAEVSWPDGQTRILANVVVPGGRSLFAGTLGWSMIRFRNRFYLGQPDGCFHPLGSPGSSTDLTGGYVPAIPETSALCVPSREAVPIPDSLGLDDIQVPPQLEGWSAEPPTHFPPVLNAAWSPMGSLLLLPDLAFSDAAALLRDDGTLAVIHSSRVFHPGPAGLLTTRTLLDGVGFRMVAWKDLR